MFTVIIAEQEYLEYISEYQLFLKPFINPSQVAFCQWEPEMSQSMQEAVPGLQKAVAQQQDWRAVILCDKRGIAQKNPFNIVEYHEEKWDGKEPLGEYYERRLQAKKQAYKQASEQPFVRLVTRLCEDPTVSRQGRKSDPEDKAQADYEYEEYRECARYKQELRDEIRGDEILQYVMPKEIICIAQRHYNDMNYALKSIWSEQDEQRYSRFYDWNLYYDKMRYLVFDVADERKQAYQTDLVRLLLSVILLSGHDLPQGCLHPDRVYQLSCNLDEDDMKQLMCRYEGKMEATKNELTDEQNAIRNRKIERLSDQDAARIFCNGVSIPVQFQDNEDEDDFYCTEHFGLSYDCPVDNESTVFEGSCQKNKDALDGVTKRSARAVENATDDVRRKSVLTDDRVCALNEYQVQDIGEYVDQEEKRMIDSYVGNTHSTQHDYDRMKDSREDVQDVLDQRMTRNNTILCGVLCLVVVFLGLLPLFIMNPMEQFFDLPIPGTIVLVILALVIVTAAGFICLFVLRRSLTDRVSEYNETMRSIVNEIHENLRQSSAYLSHACNVMRGNSVLSYHDTHDTNETQKVLVLQKHIQDLEAQQAELKDIFGQYLDPKLCRKAGEEEAPYDYDFSRTTEYSYPMPKAPDLGTKIEFLEPGNYVDIPYGIVKSMKLRREELYD